MSEDRTPPDVLDAIRDRSSARAFAPDPPTDAELATLFAAAGNAPSAGNAQPWRFVLTKRGTGPHVALADALRGSNRWAAAAPVLVVAAVLAIHEHPTKPPKENRLALFELGLATGNLLTQATALGLVARPVGGFDRTATRSVLAIPDGYLLGVLLAIGRPGDPAALEPDARAKAARMRERLDVSGFVFEGTWGRPAQISSDR